MIVKRVIFKPMGITSTHAIKCQECDSAIVSFEQYEAVEWAKKHIKEYHSKIYENLEKRGRELARSQNGCGYYDGSDKDTGWQKASTTFRDAWIKHAVEEMLGLRL